MKIEKEKIIGTFLYAASPQSYEVYHLIFTSSRIIAVSLSWKKSNIFADIINTFYAATSFPFQGGVNTDSLLSRRWREIKEQNKGRPMVDYKATNFQEMLSKGLLTVVLHEFFTTPYSMIKNVTLSQAQISDEYKIGIDGGFLNLSTYVVPTYAVKEFKNLISKTPIADKLKD